MYTGIYNTCIMHIARAGCVLSEGDMNISHVQGVFERGGHEEGIKVYTIHPVLF